MSMSEERINALGKFEAAKKRLTVLGIRAASHLDSLKSEVNKAILSKDFINVDLDKCGTLVEHLKGLQAAAREQIEIMNYLKDTYNL